MASLAVRILRLLCTCEHGLTRREIEAVFVSFRPIDIGCAVDRLHRSGLLSRVSISADDSVGRYAPTDFGRAQATSATPPRFRAPRAQPTPRNSGRRSMYVQ